MPPAKILITAGLDEFQIVPNAYQCAIDLEVFEKDSVRRLFVVPGKSGTRILRVSHGRDAHATSASQLKQPTFNLRHAGRRFERRGRWPHWRIKLIAEQVLDVIDQQLLM